MMKLYETCLNLIFTVFILSMIALLPFPCKGEEPSRGRVPSIPSLQERRSELTKRTEPLQKNPPEAGKESDREEDEEPEDQNPSKTPAVQTFNQARPVQTLNQARPMENVNQGRPVQNLNPGRQAQTFNQGRPVLVNEGRRSSGDKERPKYVTMNFKNVELQSLVKLMSDLTGRNFIVDPGLKGQMTIISPNEISIEEAYQVFLSVLEVHGFTVVESGDVVKVIQAVEAKAKGLETRVQRRDTRLEDRMITQLIPLSYGDAADFAKFLGPLIPKTGLLVPYPDTNTLILIDTVSNIDRLMKIVVELDVPASRDQIVIIPLESANAEKLATKLTNLFQRKETGARAAKEHVRIVSDETTNSLIVMASPLMVKEIREMIAKLDQKKLRSRGVRIYPLQHAVAEDVSKVLGHISGKGGETTGKDGKGQAPPVISKETQISPDKATNSLIVIADPDEHQTLEEIIRELDQPRTMVYVEALIVEVSASKSLELGVEWRLADSFHGGFKEGSKGGVVLGGSPGAAAVDALAGGAIPTGFSAGIIGRAITLGDVVFPSFGAFVKAIRSDTDFNILSTPQILTLDNAEALIEVGQNIPFVTQVAQASQTSYENAIQTFEYRDVGVTLKVTPQINDNRAVRLGIEQSVKSVLERTALGGTVLAPTTTFRRAKTAITVKDGETAVIGGLIENRLDRGVTETPCLGSVPGLGWLFKSTTDRDEKTNLLVFLSPHIVENPEENRRLYQQKRNHADGEMGRAKEQIKNEPLRRMLLGED